MQPTTNRNLLSQSIEGQLRDLLVGRVCIVGVGNRHRRDDAAGPRVIDLRRPEAQGAWIDSGVAPENHLEPIARTNPDTILIVDAVDFGGNPGECQIMESGAMEMMAMSTHAGSLQMLGDYLFIRTGVRPIVLAIQPENIDMGESLSDPVARSVHKVADVLCDLLSRDGPVLSKE
jgi:hydrogenase 3 maturation protease